MDEWKTIGFITFLAAVAIAILLMKQARRRRYPAGALPYFSRQYLLSKGETAFFRVLRAGLPSGLLVAPKVRVSDLIACDGAAWKRGFGGRISQKHVDFVLIDERNTEIILVVELDDRSHRQPDRRERDEFLDRAFAAAGVAVLHVPAAANYDPIRVRALLSEHVSKVNIRRG